MPHRIPTFGLPRISGFQQERRDPLPEWVTELRLHGCRVTVEEGAGAEMGITERSYRRAGAEVVSRREVLGADVVVSLLPLPTAELSLMRRGAVLMSMLRPEVDLAYAGAMARHGIEGISLDAVVDDEGRRLVEDLRGAAWSGVRAAFEALQVSPELLDGRPLRVMVLGAGRMGKRAVEASLKYGAVSSWAERRAPVEALVVGPDLTARSSMLRSRLTTCDVLIDATARLDLSRPVVENRLLSVLPPHAVLCDLSSVPYVNTRGAVAMPGIEGIPRGSLAQWCFLPDDPAWQETVPSWIPRDVRRTTVACSAWPGFRPYASMRRYGEQMGPLWARLVAQGGAVPTTPGRHPVERALWRARTPHPARLDEPPQPSQPKSSQSSPLAKSA